MTFKWGVEQQTAFQELKCLITQAETLGYFRADCRTRIVADASSVGLGAVLAQEQGGTWRAVSYAEEALSWKRITNPWNESIHVRQSLVRELRDGCCGCKGTTLKSCTGLGRQTLLLHYLV